MHLGSIVLPIVGLNQNGKISQNRIIFKVQPNVISKCPVGYYSHENNGIIDFKASIADWDEFFGMVM